MNNSRITTVAVGGRAEQAAAEYLVRKGYEIIERNYRRRYCEIDIIARADDTLHFVEVRYRYDDHFGGGLATIAHDKLRRMARAAETWVARHRWDGEYVLSAIAVGGPHFEILEFIDTLW